MDIQIFANTQCQLGESPLWDKRSQSLFWLDIYAKKLYKKDFSTDSAIQSWNLPRLTTAIVLDEDNQYKLWLATEQGVATFNYHTDIFTPVCNFTHFSGELRTNDGAVDPYGRFWFGTMQKNPKQDVGSIYMFDNQGNLNSQLYGFGIPNTMQWSADGQYMYIADSLYGVIYRYQFNKSGIDPISRELFVRMSKRNGTPDGSAVDIAGGLWTALWDGSKVVRYITSGLVDLSISVPVLRPTSCAFGGPRLHHLFITSACTGLTKEQLQIAPYSGSIFVVELEQEGCLAFNYNSDVASKSGK